MGDCRTHLPAPPARQICNKNKPGYWDRGEPLRCCTVMDTALYYRRQAAIARRLAAKVTDEGAVEILEQAAKDYEEIAEDLETGAAEIRHPDLTQQNRR